MKVWELAFNKSVSNYLEMLSETFSEIFSKNDKNNSKDEDSDFSKDEECDGIVSCDFCLIKKECIRKSASINWNKKAEFLKHTYEECMDYCAEKVFEEQKRTWENLRKKEECIGNSEMRCRFCPFSGNKDTSSDDACIELLSSDACVEFLNREATSEEVGILL